MSDHLPKGIPYRGHENSNKSQECMGCRLLQDTCCMHYAYIEKEHTYECPCQVCLIKGICGQYCGPYLTYTGGYFEYLKKHPDKFIQQYHEPVPPRTEYRLTVQRGIPITVKFDMYEGKGEVCIHGTFKKGDFVRD